MAAALLRYEGGDSFMQSSEDMSLLTGVKTRSRFTEPPHRGVHAPWTWAACLSAPEFVLGQLKSGQGLLAHRPDRFHVGLLQTAVVVCLLRPRPVCVALGHWCARGWRPLQLRVDQGPLPRLAQEPPVIGGPIGHSACAYPWTFSKVSMAHRPQSRVLMFHCVWDRQRTHHRHLGSSWSPMALYGPPSSRATFQLRPLYQKRIDLSGGQAVTI